MSVHESQMQSTSYSDPCLKLGGPVPTELQIREMEVIDLSVEPFVTYAAGVGWTVPEGCSGGFI
jgi:hypothetical protein